MSRWAADMRELEQLRAQIAGLLKVAEAAAYVDLRWRENWDVEAIFELRQALNSLPYLQLEGIRESSKQHFEAVQRDRAARDAAFDSWWKSRKRLEDQGQGDEQQPEGDEVDLGEGKAERREPEADCGQDQKQQI